MQTDVDVLIIGAGLSGISAACHLRRRCPDRTFTIFEARDAIGGTWDLFRYPGVRSDSEMFTLSYSFNPWTKAKAIVDGPEILEYVRSTAGKFGVDRSIRFRHRVISAEWSRPDAAWTVTAERPGRSPGSVETVTLTCGFLYVCSGYYDYAEGYTPAFPGAGDFPGPVVHPQHWPEDVDYAGKRVVVIGSGATAVTLVPAMAKTAAHVTMVQRSPSYVLSVPGQDPLAAKLVGKLPDRFVFPALRWKNILNAQLIYQLSQRVPEFVKRLVRKGVVSQLPAGYDVDTHFAPKYRPWDQRMCFVSDGDFFQAISEGRASVVTGEVERFTPRGVKMSSGEEAEADVIVTATGLNMLSLGGMTVTVDGAPVDPANTVVYKGLMLSGLPNCFVMSFGYTNVSWTLRADLVAEYVCRLLDHMAEHGHAVVTPVLAGPLARTDPMIDLAAGYVLRSVGRMPKQGPGAPWRTHRTYPRDLRTMRYGPLDDHVRFETAALPEQRAEAA